jgi:hypothetical protein
MQAYERYLPIVAIYKWIHYCQFFSRLFALARLLLKSLFYSYAIDHERL